jgi:hypothetical protein
MTKRLLGMTLAAAILAVLWTAVPAQADLAPVRAWAADTSAQLSRDPDARTVERRLAALRRITREIRSAGGASSAALARTGRTLDRKLIGLRTTLRGLPRYAFYLGLQAEAERLGHTSGADTDRDGILDQVDADADGDGTRNRADASIRGWGVPDAFRVRSTAAVPATAYRSGYCVWVTEQIPSPESIAAARSLRARAAGRGCAPPRTDVEATATKKKKPITLGKAKIKAKRATLEGRTLKLSVKTKKTARFRFDVVSGKRVVARAKPRKLKGAKKPKAKTVTATLDRTPAGDTLKLRITARIKKRIARGQIRLRIIAPPVTPPGACTPGTDTDGDGISNCDELRGFDYKTFQPASACPGINQTYACLIPRTQRVTSDPAKANTDGDAVSVGGVRFQLTDGEEWANFLNGGTANPAVADSDGDGLGDVEEIKRWGTNPSNVDTDSDSAKANSGVPPNLQLFDRAEILGGVNGASRAQSSPIDKDTDGDGMDDLDEILSGSRSPAIADVPTIEAVPDPDDALNIGLKDAQSSEVALTQAQGSESEKGTEDRNAGSLESTDREKVGVQVSAELELSADPSLTVGIEASYEHEWSSTETTSHEFTVSEQSRESAQQEYATTISESPATEGTVTKRFLVRNTSKLTGVTIKEMRVQLQYICLPVQVGQPQRCATPGKRTTLGVPLTPTGDVVIPANSTKAVVMTADDVPAQQLKDIISAPSNVKFYIENASLFPSGSQESLNDTIGQSVPSATASLTIDDGQGNVIDKIVAVNLNRAWGKPDSSQATPTPIPEVLDTLGIDYEFVERGTIQAIASLNGLDSKPASTPGKIAGAWLLFGEAQGLGDAQRYDELGLNVGDSAGIMYVSDADADGLFSREERVLGTVDNAPDSDGDGAAGPCASACPPGTPATYASDYFESQVGWTVGPVNGGTSYPSRSDPASTDADGDASSDAAEKAAKTDPRNPDTDGDGTADGADADPLNLPTGITTRTWTGSEMTPTSGSCNASACIITPSGKVATPEVNLCGASAAGGCAGATGFYRVTYNGNSSIPNGNPVPVGEFRVKTADDILFLARRESTESSATRTIYFELPTLTGGVSIEYRAIGTGMLMNSISIEPVSSAEFFGATSASSAAFAGIAFRAQRLTGAAPSGALNSVPLSGGVSGAQVTTAGPNISLSAGAYQGWNARFRVDVTAKDTTPLALLGVVNGTGAGGAAETTQDGPGGAGRYAGLKYYGFTATRQPVVQAQLYKDDVAETGKRTDISLMFMNRAGLSNVTFPVRVYGGAFGAGLHSVTLEPVGRALDVQRLAGEYHAPPDNSLITPQGVVWSGLGLLAGHGDAPPAGMEGDVFDNRSLGSDSGTSGELQLPSDGFHSMNDHLFPSDAGFHQWTIHVTKTGTTTCPPRFVVGSPGSIAFPDLTGLTATGRQVFPTAQPATRTWLSLSVQVCPNLSPSPTVFFDRINLASRPPGGVPAIVP